MELYVRFQALSHYTKPFKANEKLTKSSMIDIFAIPSMGLNGLHQ